MNEQPDPVRRQLLQQLLGFYPVQVMYALVDLGVPEHLAKRPGSTAAEVASATGTHEPSMRRLLRAGVGLGLIRHRSEGTLELTQAGLLLHPDTPGSVRNLTVLWGGPECWRSWNELRHSVRTGRPAYELVTGRTLFEHLAAEPQQQHVFNQAMAESTRAAAPGILAAGRFDGCERLVDVGGGSGTLLAALLQARPGIHGVLYDRPEAVEDAEPVLRDAGVLDRTTVVSGDFFVSVPTGADCYVIKSVLHDWDDDTCVRILRNCAAAMPPGASLNIVEPVVPASDSELAQDQAMLASDLNMLVCAGGLERTREEFTALLDRAGLRLEEVNRCPVGSNLSVLRACRT